MELKGRIVIFSITGCPHCKAAKSKLESLNLPYNDINLDDHPDQRAVMNKLTNRLTVPQIFFNEKHVGGNDDFQALSEDELSELIKYVSENAAPDNAPEPLQSNGAAESNKDHDNGAWEKMDELATFVQDLKAKSGIIVNHRQLFHSNPDTFTGEDVITYVAHKDGTDRTEATARAQLLIDKKFAVSLKGDQPIKDDKTLYRLLQDIPSKALNAGLPAYRSVTTASEVSTLLRKSILQLYGKYLSSDGKSVDYTGLGKSNEFESYVELTAQLQRVELENLSREEKLAFFINIYNALVVHGNIKLGFPKSTFQRYKFFNNAKYIIGGHSYSLQDIENGVLRSNRQGVGMLTKPFSKSDPRIKYILSPHEPLIHMALVCGAKSCPPIKTYSAKDIMEELKLSAASFLESDDGCCIDAEDNLIGLSMIFKWYKEDFGATPYEVLKWVRNHMSEGTKKQQLTTLIESKVYNLIHLSYDWGTNGK